MIPDEQDNQHLSTDAPEEQPSAQESSADIAAALQTEVAALNDKLLRTLADMENLRRRTAREKEETAQYAIAKFARDILTVADNFARALEAAPQKEDLPENLRNFIMGIEMTERELGAILERNGVMRIDPLGQPFDPNFHQAMFEQETADANAGTVVKVVAPGYRIGERLLRPAMVGVAKAPQIAAQDKPGETS